MEGLTAGRMVHYVPWPHEASSVGHGHGVDRAAVVCRVWDDRGLVDLQVFFDGTNDGQASSQSVVWKTSVGYNEHGGIPNTWHWIERA